MQNKFLGCPIGIRVITSNGDVGIVRGTAEQFLRWETGFYDGWWMIELEKSEDPLSGTLSVEYPPTLRYFYRH
jgi:hypothetical protein